MNGINGFTPVVAAPYTPNVVKTNAQKEADLKAAAAKTASTDVPASESSDQTNTQKTSTADLKAAVNDSINSSLMSAMGLGESSDGPSSMFSLGSVMNVLHSGSAAAGLITGTETVATRSGYKSDTVKNERTQSDIDALVKAQNLLKTPEKGSTLDISA